METPSANQPAVLEMGAWHSLKIPSIPEKIHDVETSVAEVLEGHDFSEDAIFAVRLALAEALANAIKHGNRQDPDKEVSVKFRIENSSVTISVRDEGEGFDYNNLPDPTAPDRLEIPSGRGVLLMRSYMDHVKYNNKGNEVTIVKGRGVSKCAQ